MWVVRKPNKPSSAPVFAKKWGQIGKEQRLSVRWASKLGQKIAGKPETGPTEAKYPQTWAKTSQKSVHRLKPRLGGKGTGSAKVAAVRQVLTVGEVCCRSSRKPTDGRMLC